MAALVSLSYALFVATHVLPRPLFLSYFWGENPSRKSGYYANAFSLEADHDVFFQYVERSGCKRIGLIFGPDSVDYPLTWRAMQFGYQTKYLREHVREGSSLIWNFRDVDADWPCMMYASYGVPEHVPERGKQYISAGDYHTYIRNLEWEFGQSEQILFSLSSMDSSVSEEVVSDAATTIVSRAQDKEIISNGNDPQLFLPVLDVKSVRSAVLKVSIQIPVDTDVQLYYMTKEQPHYTEKNSIRKEGRQGENDLYFFLPLDDIVGPVRFDPGTKPGVYVLHELEIRAVKKIVNSHQY